MKITKKDVYYRKFKKSFAIVVPTIMIKDKPEMVFAWMSWGKIWAPATKNRSEFENTVSRTVKMLNDSEYIKEQEKRHGTVIRATPEFEKELIKKFKIKPYVS